MMRHLFMRRSLEGRGWKSPRLRRWRSRSDGLIFCRSSARTDRPFAALPRGAAASPPAAAGAERARGLFRCRLQRKEPGWFVGEQRQVSLGAAADLDALAAAARSGVELDDDAMADGSVSRCGLCVEFLRANKPPMWGYPVSKVLLEKEASRFAEEHGISLVTLCPVITVGAAPAPNAVTSVPNCLSLLSGDEAEFAVLRGIEWASGTVALVHVDDVCRAELFLAEEEAAAGRYLCCSLNTTVVQLARFLTDKYPRYPVKTNLLSGDLLEKPRVCLSSAKLVREGFEYKYKTLGEIYDDVVEYGKVLGILPN